MASVSETAPAKSKYSWLWSVFLLIVILGLMAVVFKPNHIRSGPSRLSSIINNLRQIDGAKQQWALEHGITNALQFTNQPTEQDVAPYLRSSIDRVDRNGFGFDRNGHPISGAGEKYTINSLGLSPEAQFTSEFKENVNFLTLPKGTIVRLKVIKLGEVREEIILPDGTKMPN